MTFYEDLTYYSEDHFEHSQNIGWLDTNKEFPRAKPSFEFIEALYEYIKCPFNKQRHSHPTSFEYRGNEIKLGYSEIRVLSNKTDQKFAAPDTILKSILDQEYSPPQVFQKAVIEGPKPGTTEYDQFIERYNENCLWGESPDYAEQCHKLNKAMSEHQNTQVQKWIQNKEISIDITTIDGSILNSALLNNNVEVALWVIDHGIDINKFSGIELNTAIAQGHNNIVNLLIDKHMKLNMYSPKLNPLFTAIRTKNVEAVEVIMDSGIDLNIKYSNEFMQDIDALKLAQQLKFHPAIELLQDKYN
ncbi:ankyrin repeat domain-containing protein [Paenibacillus kandeliae]|uniref:ankyrin repeat domain-containing protein n=1 Tax=Paenibacillus kandeliae TaxID=3231269 RepID=UPI0034582F65